MTEKVNTALQWLFKQAPVVIVLIGTNIAQYYYFTNEISELKTEVKELRKDLYVPKHEK